MEVKHIQENDKINIKIQETKHNNQIIKTEQLLKHISSDVSVKSVTSTDLLEFDYDLCNGVNYII